MTVLNTPMYLGAGGSGKATAQPIQSVCHKDHNRTSVHGANYPGSRGQEKGCLSGRKENQRGLARKK